VLQSLLDKSLLRQETGPQDEPRFTMLDTIREYAAQRLRESGELAALQERHAAFFVALAEAAEPELQGPEQATWLQRLEVDHDNLRAALRWSQLEAAQRPDRAETGWRIAGALARFWNAYGHASEGRAWLEQVLENRGGVEHAQSPYLAKALRRAGEAAADQGDFDRAIVLFEQGLAIYRALNDPVGVAFMLMNQGRTLRWQGAYARVEALEEESLRLFREHGSAWAAGMALLSLGDVALDQGHADRASARFREALSLYQNLHDVVGAGWSLINLGRAANVRGDTREATILYNQSLRMFRELEYDGGVVEALLELGHVAHAQRDDARALMLYRESLALCRDRGWRIGLSDCFAGIAGVAAAEHRPAGAARLFGAAEALRAELGAPRPPVARAAFDRDLALARAQLDDASWDLAWSEGAAMPLEQAITLALEEREHTY
jgi:tetratricopeptide (TPR) repeat protein